MIAAFDNFPALLLWLPLIGGILCFFIKNERNVKTWSLFSSILTLALVAVSLTYTDQKHYLLNEVKYFWLTDIGASFGFVLDGISRTLVLLNAIAFPLIFAATWNTKYSNGNSFHGLMLFAQCGMMGVFMATDAMAFYFFWELALIPTYFLASQWGGEKRIQAAFKFFIYTFAGSLLLLIGILYVYLKTPDQSFSMLSFYKVKLSAGEQNWLFWLFFIAFAIKMPVFPFHTWQPDVYEQSPPAVTMVLSSVMVKMGVFAVIRWLLPVFPSAVKHFDSIVIGLSVTGIIYASCVAIVQDDFKRLIAWSSIAHIGLMCAALFTLNNTAISGVIIQMFNHGVNILGLWIVAGLLEQQLGIRKISQLGGIAQKAPVLTVLLVIVALANIALPLTNAFVGEFLMFNGLFGYSKYVAAFAGLSIILAAIYTLNMIKNVFYGSMSPISERVQEITVNQRLVLAVIVVLIFIVGVYPAPMFDLIRSSTDTLLSRIAAK